MYIREEDFAAATFEGLWVAYGIQLYWKRNSYTGLFLWISQKFYEQLFFIGHVLWLPLVAGFFETSILKEVRVLRYFH